VINYRNHFKSIADVAPSG